MKANVLAAAIRRLWDPAAYAWLEEVPDRTGGANRRADAVAISCWPSRGLYAIGFEIKVSRSDWTRELKDVAKSVPIQRYCRHWYMVTTPGIVALGELPLLWGLIEVSDGKPTIVVRASELDPVPIDWAFSAALLRNQADVHVAAEQRGYDRAAREYAERYADAIEMRSNLANAETRLAHQEGDLRKLKEQQSRWFARHEELRKLGIDVGDYVPTDRMLAAIRAHQQMQHVDAERWANQLVQAAFAMRELATIQSRDKEGTTDAG